MEIEEYAHWGEVPNPDPKIIFVLDYYQGAFSLFHDELKREGYRSDIPHPIRERFWGLLPNRIYEPLESRPLIQSYIRSVSQQLAQIIIDVYQSWLSLRPAC